MTNEDDSPPPPTDEDAPPRPLVALVKTDGALPDRECRRADGKLVDPAEWQGRMVELEARLTFGALMQGRSLKKTALAIDTVLRQHPYWHGCIRYNEMSRRDEVGQADATRVATTTVRLWLERNYSCEAARENVDDAIHAIASANPYHPVHEYLESLPPWDEIPRIGELLNILDVPNDTRRLAHAYLEAWMIGAVKRIYVPGCKMDYLLTIYGVQGSKKSTFWESLIGGYPYYGSLPARHWTDSYRLHSVWAHEIGELEAVTTKKELAEIKEHLASKGETFSLKHEKQATTWLRRFVFCGTSNRDDFLRDETGERRFWIIESRHSELLPIDTEYIVRSRDQLWAEAKHHYRNGKGCYLSDPALIAQHNAQAAKFSAQEDPWTDAVEDFIREYRLTRSPFRTRTCLDALKIPLEKRTRVESNRVAEILRRKGLKYQAVYIDRETVKGWQWPPL